MSSHILAAQKPSPGPSGQFPPSHYLPIKKNFGERGHSALLVWPSQVITYIIAVLLHAAWPVAANDEGWQ